MKSKLIALMSLAAIGATGIALTSFAIPKGLTKQEVKATPYTRTLTQENLANVVLEDCVIFEGKTDKHFTIPIDSERYIEGWVLYNYYSGQTAGQYLGSRFSANGDNFDFNFIISMRGLKHFKYTM